MIKVYTAYTDEVDDIRVAVVAQVKEQIDSAKALLKNMAGIVSLHTDFI